MPAFLNVEHEDAFSSRRFIQIVDARLLQLIWIAKMVIYVWMNFVHLTTQR